MAQVIDISKTLTTQERDRLVAQLIRIRKSLERLNTIMKEPT